MYRNGYQEPDHDTGDEDHIKNSLTHIEELLQRGNQLLYGEDVAEAAPSRPPPPPAAAATTSGSVAARPMRKNAAPGSSVSTRKRSVSIDPQATATHQQQQQQQSSSTNMRGQRSLSRTSMNSEEERYVEMERFFNEDAMRIAKIRKENRRIRQTEARRRANESPKPRVRATEDEDFDPEKVDLEEIRSRIHREVEEYRTSCKQDVERVWHVLTPRKKKYVSPYTSKLRGDQNKWAQRPAPQVKQPQRPVRSKVQPPTTPTRKKRTPIDRSVPIWERLYDDASRQRRRSVSEGVHDGDLEGDGGSQPRFPHRRPSALSSASKYSRMSSAPVQTSTTPTQTTPSRAKPRTPASSVGKKTNPARGKSPDAKPPLRRTDSKTAPRPSTNPLHENNSNNKKNMNSLSSSPANDDDNRYDRSDSPMNAPPLRNHGADERLKTRSGGTEKEQPSPAYLDMVLDDEHAPTMPFISPLDLRDLN